MCQTRIGLFIAVAILALSSSGCYRAVHLERIGYEIADACPGARFKRDFSLSLGGASWGIMKNIALSVEKDDPEVRAIVGGLSRIELVVYEVSGISKVDARPIGEVVRGSLDDDWELMVKSADKNEMVWIHYREDDGRVREMNITAFDDGELVIVRLSGRLDEIMEMAIADHGGFTGRIVDTARE